MMAYRSPAALEMAVKEAAKASTLDTAGRCLVSILTGCYAESLRGGEPRVRTQRWPGATCANLRCKSDARY